jgi:cysteinyl-tRNA synthetase
MNITDIDDKIILRTHLNHLASMADLAAAALAAADAQEGDAKRALEAALASAQAALAIPKPTLAELLDAQGTLAAAAEAAGVAGVAACDVQSQFLELTAAWEADFFEDMRALNVMPPDAVTRVSDYVPEIIAYIQTIMANGYCYEAGGSVYFDTAAFSSAPSKTYGKLDPSKVAAGQAAGKAGAAAAASEGGGEAADGEAADGEAADGEAVSADWTEGKSTAELLAEGEGALSAGSEADKRQPADFVLWKASKVGEPAWESPWGPGRPGWHIECSAMASDLLGDAVDLNSGGVDLKFPHHENQIAQAEAHFDCCEGASWVNYFLHSGHLHIDGLKMSKSLKNFITIKGALTQYSPSQIRFLFLMRRFSEPMEYSEKAMASAGKGLLLVRPRDLFGRATR